MLSAVEVSLPETTVSFEALAKGDDVHLLLRYTFAKAMVYEGKF